jgi:hypothetical protein
MSIEIDLSFDFRSDTPPGKDPDALSPTLRLYHKQLWGRSLPNGQKFTLNDSLSPTKAYLTHTSKIGNFELSSDSVIPTFTRWKRMQSIVNQIDEAQNEAFRALGYTMGGMILWPRRSNEGFRSINVMRGFNSKIADRMDLTLECVKRHYVQKPNPLDGVLNANREFFKIFVNFEGYVSHFLLQDLIESASGEVKFFMPFNDFAGSSRPEDLDAYLKYRENSMDFVRARNQRINKLCQGLAWEDNL